MSVPCGGHTPLSSPAMARGTRVVSPDEAPNHIHSTRTAIDVEHPMAIALMHRAFGDLIANFRVIPVGEKGPRPHEEVVEDVDATSTEKDAWIVRSERDLQNVMNDEDGDIERTTVTETTDAYTRTRRWWQNPVKHQVTIATDNTPETGKTTVDFIGSKAEVPEALR